MKIRVLDVPQREYLMQRVKSWRRRVWWMEPDKEVTIQLAFEWGSKSRQLWSGRKWKIIMDVVRSRVGKYNNWLDKLSPLIFWDGTRMLSRRADIRNEINQKEKRKENKNKNKNNETTDTGQSLSYQWRNNQFFELAGSNQLCFHCFLLSYSFGRVFSGLLWIYTRVQKS